MKNCCNYIVILLQSFVNCYFEDCKSFLFWFARSGILTG